MFYNLIGVESSASQFVIEEFLEIQRNLIYNPSQYGVLSEQVLRLQQIIQNVGEILLDPSKRQLYDREEPPFPVALVEFSSIFIDDLLIRTLQRDAASEGHDGLYSDSISSILKVLYNSHKYNHIGLFLNALRQLQSSPFALLLSDQSIIISISRVYGAGEIDHLLAALPAPKMTSCDLEAFRMFLQRIIKKYRPYIWFIQGEYTVFDRIVNLERNLGY